MRQSLIAVGMFLLTGGMVGCGTSSTQEKEDLIVVDVSKDYPKKELILQDLFDVEYIPLETTDEFVVKGKITDVGKDILVLTNVRQGIFLFMTGKEKRYERLTGGDRVTRSIMRRMVSIWTMRKEKCLLVICSKER